MRVFFILITIFLALASCTQTQQAETNILSPDKSMLLVTSVEQNREDPKAYLCIILEIKEPNGKVIFSENTHASVRMKWNIAWESNQRIKLSSADIGDVYWSRQPDETWHREQKKVDNMRWE